MSRAVHVPYTVEQDENGIWCACAQLRPGVGAHGEGDSREAAIADLREALLGLIAEFGVPDELTLMLDIRGPGDGPAGELDRLRVRTCVASRTAGTRGSASLITI